MEHLETPYNTLEYIRVNNVQTKYTQCMSKRSRTGDETVQFSVRLPVELKQRIDEKVKELDLDVTTWIRHACREKLERDSNQGDKVFNAELYKVFEEFIKSKNTQTSEKMKQRI